MVYSAVSLFMTSLVMSAIIFVILAFNKLLPRMFSAKVRYIVWLVMLIGFIIPFRPIIGNGIVQIPIPVSIEMQADDSEGVSLDESMPITESLQNKTDTEPVESSTFSLMFSNIKIYVLIWGIVAIIIFFFHILRYIRFVKMVARWGIQVKDEKVLSVFQSIKEQIGLSDRQVSLKVCKFVSSSMLTGFLHPVIILPENHFDKEELQLIFKHELIHLKRHDLFVKFLSVVVTSLYWFNPLVYWMCAEMQTDGEAACDEAVLQNADIESRQFYGEIIIGMIGNKHEIRTALSTCFYAGKSNMKRRLDSIMNTGKKMKKPAIVGIVVVAVTLTLLSGSVFAFSNNTKTVQSVNYEISEEKAKEIALTKVGGGSVVKCKIDYEDANKVYEIEIIHGDKKYSMDVEVINSRITDYEEEIIVPSEPLSTSPATQGVSDKLSATMTSEITAERAKEIALSKVGGGTVAKCKTDYENGRKVYEIEIIYENKKHEMDIDIVNSTIMNYEVETIRTSENSNFQTYDDDDDDDDDYDDDDDDYDDD